MAPLVPFYYLPDAAYRHCEFFCERAIGFVSRSISVTNVEDLTFCQFCRTMFLTARNRLGMSSRFMSSALTTTRSTFCYSVSVIISICAQPKMIGIHARPIVAVMENVEFGRYFSIYDRPANPWRGPSAMSEIKRSVSIGGYRPNPHPARSEFWSYGRSIFIYLAPKSVHELLFRNWIEIAI